MNISLTDAEAKSMIAEQFGASPEEITIIRTIPIKQTSMMLVDFADYMSLSANGMMEFSHKVDMTSKVRATLGTDLEQAREVVELTLKEHMKI